MYRAQVVRIVMLVANPIVYDGRVIRHAQTLVEAGHEVTVLGVIGPSDSAEPLDPGLRFSSWRLDRRRRGIFPRVIWATSAMRQRAALSIAGWSSERTMRRLVGVAELAVSTSSIELFAKAASLECDVYHGNDLNTLPAAAWAGQLRRRPFVYDAHELYVDETPALSETERTCRRIAEGHLARRAHAVLTVNELIADELKELYGIPRPVVVRNLPRLVDLSVPGDDAGRPGTLRLLYHGAHIGLSQPGTDDVLRAMARIRDRLELHLTMRGRISDEERKMLLGRIEELGISSLVDLRPPVSGAAALVRAAAEEGEELGLAVHPPLSRSYSYTTSSKVYEYQAAGLAVCASDLIGNRLTVDERAGVFYPPGNDERLAEILLTLGQDRERLLSMRRAARQRAVSELCWEREQGRLLAVYDQLSLSRR